MYCPICRAEFSEGISRCAACDAALVEFLTEVIEPEDDLAVLFKTPDPVLLMVIKSLLKSAGIPYRVQGEEGLHMFPLSFAGGFFNPSAYGAVIQVRRQDLPDAKTLLEESVTPPESED